MAERPLVLMADRLVPGPAEGSLPAFPISLQVPAGGGILLAGPAGAGKSLLLDTLAGRCVAASGRLTLAGLDATRMAVHRRTALGLAACPTGGAPRSALRIADLLGLAARNGVGPDPFAEPRLAQARDRLLEQGRLRLQAADPPTRWRAGLIAALIGRPRVVMVDAPLAGQPAPAQDDALGLLAAVRTAGIALVVADRHAAPWPAIVDERIRLTGPEQATSNAGS